MRIVIFSHQSHIDNLGCLEFVQDLCHNQAVHMFFFAFALLTEESTEPSQKTLPGMSSPDNIRFWHTKPKGTNDRRAR